MYRANSVRRSRLAWFSDKGSTTTAGTGLYTCCWWCCGGGGGGGGGVGGVVIIVVVVVVVVVVGCCCGSGYHTLYIYVRFYILQIIWEVVVEGIIPVDAWLSVTTS